MEIFDLILNTVNKVIEKRQFPYWYNNELINKILQKEKLIFNRKNIDCLSSI